MRIIMPRLRIIWSLSGFIFAATALITTSPAEARRVSQAPSYSWDERQASPRWQVPGDNWTEERATRPRVWARHGEGTARSRADSRRLRRAERANSAWQSEAVAAQPSRRGRKAVQEQAFATGSAGAPQERAGYEQNYPTAPVTAAPVPATKRGRAVASTSTTGVGGGGVVDEARRWIGTNPTNRGSLWCAAFMNFVLERTGHGGTGSNFAKSFASFGQRVSGPQVGAIAVMSRKGGGHVGVVSGIDASGNPIIISGNSRGRRVAEGVYPRGRIYAYVMP